jgi:sucrose phosphorylase
VEVTELTGTEKDIYSLFAILYDKNRAFDCLERLKELFSDYGHTLAEQEDTIRDVWDETDVILITYGDVVRSDEKPDKPYLQVLETVLKEYLDEIISTVHILPFFPSSSDAGFSVIDYKKVRNDLGTWSDIERLATEYRLMGDLIINHTSRFSEWFNNYQKDESPGKDYFIEVDPEEDISTTTRPRSSPLLTMVKTVNGFRHVWTTFSSDQIDLDFSNPDVLLTFIDIFLFYYSKGMRVFRLDAIPYLWKKIGTSSIHLKETHQVVKLFREIADCIDSDITLLTETNVPFDENYSYFGDDDEAHMIYQFSLSPLLLHAILSENTSYLTDWAADLPEPPSGCTYLNFTASHDGIGVRPLEGLIPQDELDQLVKKTKERGGFISYKEDPQNGQSPYELNITYFDAFEEPGHPRTDLQIKRYLCSQIVALSLKGVPGIYFHNFTATKNNIEGVLESGNKRDINRRHWMQKDLVRCFKEEESEGYCPLEDYTELMKKRKKHAAFHPSGGQKVIDLNDSLFVFIRTAPEGAEKIAVISNFSSSEVCVEPESLKKLNITDTRKKDIITDEKLVTKEGLKLDGLQTVWLIV